jgi:hypothetical protein
VNKSAKVVLVRISVHGIVTSKGGLHAARDANGTLLEFVDEAENGQMVLKVYQNSLPILTYLLAEKPINGWNKGNWTTDCQYYVVVNGRRYSHLYVDVENKKIGTRHCFNATYTIDSIGEKQKPSWREYRRLRKKAVRACSPR